MCYHIKNNFSSPENKLQRLSLLITDTIISAFLTLTLKRQQNSQIDKTLFVQKVESDKMK